MKERPIPMSAPMVRATLRTVDPKTQTRRVVKEPGWATPDTMELFDGMPWASDPLQGDRDIPCPYGVPGDRLWCREAWRTHAGYDHCSPSQMDCGAAVLWLADDARRLNGPEQWGRYRHARFMPRWASRITLEITGVRVERLQEISEADAMAEGIERVVAGDGWRRYADSRSELAGLPPCATARNSYRALWESINGAGSWDLNPWVWVIEFRRLP